MKKNKRSRTLGGIFGDSVFTANEVNTGRQIELDIAKGFAILFMVWVHTTEPFGNYQGFGNAIVEILGGPFAAPVFMVCMGIGMCFAKKAEPKDLAKRGVGLLFVGLLLNLFRYVIPLLIAYAATGETLFLYTFPFLFGVDVMQFAGFAFLFFALAKRFNWSDKTLAVIAILSSIVGMLLKEASTGLVYVDQFIGYIWGNENAETYFPFLNWIIFPIFGYLFGKLLIRCANKSDFYRKVAPICGVIGLSYIVFAYIFGFGMYGENGYYYFLGTVDAIAVIMLVIGIFGFCFILTKLKETAPIRALQNMSGNINTVYCIQWTLIGSIGILLSGFFPEDGLSFAPMTILAVVFMISSTLIANWYQKRNFLSMKAIKIVLSSMLVAAIIISVVGLNKVESYLYDEGYDYSQEIYENDSDLE